MSNTDRASAPAGGFGKMLNSLHGLQQRLEDFSIADVANAEANAQTLILRLRQFQDTITAVALLKSAEADIDRSIAAIQPVDIEAINLDSLGNHSQLHAIVKASKLIKLQKLIKALKAGADEGESIAEPTGVADAEILPTVASSETRHAEFSDTAEPSQSKQEPATTPDIVEESTVTSLAPENDSINASTTSPAALLEAAADSPTVAFPTIDDSPNTPASTDFPTAQAEFETAVAAIVKTSSTDVETLLEDFPAPGAPSTASLVAEHLPAVEPATQLPQSVKPKHGLKTAAKKPQKSRDDKAGQLNESKALVPANESFDLRLLGDLVSNYGEFAANPNLPATVKKKEVQNFEPVPGTTPEIQTERPNPVEAAAPLVKNTGDFDRQLKKIIKDYGEYDLYSDKPTANLKKAGILAFVFLGLVFGGIYFFKAPPSTAKTAPLSANSPGSASQADQKSQPGAEEASGDHRATVRGAIPNVEKPTAKK